MLIHPLLLSSTAHTRKQAHSYTEQRITYITFGMMSLTIATHNNPIQNRYL